MSRKGLLVVGLSVVLGTGVGTVLPARTAQAGDAIESGGATYRADEIEASRWGDAGTEKGEMEAPRWGDAGTEKGEIEAPRG